MPITLGQFLGLLLLLGLYGCFSEGGDSNEVSQAVSSAVWTPGTVSPSSYRI